MTSRGAQLLRDWRRTELTDTTRLPQCDGQALNRQRWRAHDPSEGRPSNPEGRPQTLPIFRPISLGYSHSIRSIYKYLFVCGQSGYISMSAARSKQTRLRANLIFFPPNESFFGVVSRSVPCAPRKWVWSSFGRCHEWAAASPVCATAGLGR